VVVALPVLGVDPGEQARGLGRPAPPQVVGQVAQALHLRGQLDVGDLEDGDVDGGLLGCDGHQDAARSDAACTKACRSPEAPLSTSRNSTPYWPGDATRTTRAVVATVDLDSGIWKRSWISSPTASGMGLSSSIPLMLRLMARAASGSPAPAVASTSKWTVKRASRRTGTSISRGRRSSHSGPAGSRRMALAPASSSSTSEGSKSPRAA